MSKPATAAVRCYSLSLDGQGNKTLKAQELHGKRMDGTSQKRRVRSASPLVWGSLDLRDLYDAHMKDVRLNASCKRPVLHFVIKMPMQVLVDGDDAPGKFRGKTQDERKKLMGRQAINFINETHGGNAVFAARVDRDEAGELIVDIFAAPKYDKTTKNRGKPKTEVWSSPTKYGKELAIKHQAEIAARHSEAKGLLTAPRHVGIALQSEFAEFFERENKMNLTRKAKDSFADDRLETEAFKKVKDAEKEIESERVRLEDARKAMLAERQTLDDERDALNAVCEEVAKRADVVVKSEADVSRQIRILDGVRTEVSQLITSAAERLGVGATFAEIRDRISAAINDVMDPFQVEELSPTEDPLKDTDGPGFGM